MESHVQGITLNPLRALYRWFRSSAIAGKSVKKSDEKRGSMLHYMGSIFYIVAKLDNPNKKSIGVYRFIKTLWPICVAIGLSVASGFVEFFILPTGWLGLAAVIDTTQLQLFFSVLKRSFFMLVGAKSLSVLLNSRLKLITARVQNRFQDAMSQRGWRNSIVARTPKSDAYQSVYWGALPKIIESFSTLLLMGAMFGVRTIFVLLSLPRVVALLSIMLPVGIISLHRRLVQSGSASRDWFESERLRLQASVDNRRKHAASIAGLEKQSFAQKLDISDHRRIASLESLKVGSFIFQDLAGKMLGLIQNCGVYVIVVYAAMVGWLPAALVPSVIFTCFEVTSSAGALLEVYPHFNTIMTHAQVIMNEWDSAFSPDEHPVGEVVGEAMLRPRRFIEGAVGAVRRGGSFLLTAPLRFSRWCLYWVLPTSWSQGLYRANTSAAKVAPAPLSPNKSGTEGSNSHLSVELPSGKTVDFGECSLNSGLHLVHGDNGLGKSLYFDTVVSGKLPDNIKIKWGSGVKRKLYNPEDTLVLAKDADLIPGQPSLSVIERLAHLVSNNPSKQEISGLEAFIDTEIKKAYGSDEEANRILVKLQGGFSDHWASTGELQQLMLLSQIYRLQQTGHSYKYFLLDESLSGVHATKLDHYVGLLLDLCESKPNLSVVLVHHGSEQSEFAKKVAKVSVKDAK